jgi:hypothetical protein
MTARGHLTIYRYLSDASIVPYRHRLNTDTIGSSRATIITDVGQVANLRADW